jgi:hypothetical protein
MSVEIAMSPLQHALVGWVLFTQPVVTRPHEYCTAEYTLAAKVAGTYSLAVVFDMQGSQVADPKALSPISERLVGSMMLVMLSQFRKV